MDKRLSNIRHNFQKSILILEIRDLCASIVKLKNHISRLENQICSSLKRNTRNISNSDLNQKWFKNLSGTQIPENAPKVASLGINFGLTVDNRETSTFNIIADIELNINKIPSESQDEARLKIVNCVNNFFKSDNNKKSRLLQPFNEIKEAKIFIKNNP